MGATMSSEPGVLPAGGAGEEGPPEADGRLHLRRLLVGSLVVLVTVGALRLAGVDVMGWLEATWDNLSGVGLAYLACACACKTLESASNAAAYRSILRASYPEGGVSFRMVWGAYQGGTALNQVMPVNSGTLVTLGLYRATIPGATFVGLVAVLGVQMIMF